jgi:hypothetical protein
MAVWQVREAKTCLSELIEDADSEGRRSSPVMVRNVPSSFVKGSR